MLGKTLKPFCRKKMEKTYKAKLGLSAEDSNADVLLHDDDNDKDDDDDDDDHEVLISGES